MKIALYLSTSAFPPEGGYVLVPDCFRPSVECNRSHGPLLPCGQMTLSDDHIDGHWQKIISEFDRNTFALIDFATAELLFGVHIARPQTASLERVAGSCLARNPERSAAENFYLDTGHEFAANGETVQQVHGTAHLLSRASHRA
ncbi:MAG: hypothetical protein ABIP44_10370 [Pseudoxanthomonas sp.]